MSAPRVLLVKAHVRGHVKKNGSVVRPYETKKPAAVSKPPVQTSLFSHMKQPAKSVPPGGITHPRKNDDGHDVVIKSPHKPSAVDTWRDPESVATFVPHGAVPDDLYGVPFASWKDAPTTIEGWASVPGQIDLDEPELVAAPGKHISAGVVVEEPDGRVWMVAPTNAFGGYMATFPKGTQEDGLSLQATALKEAWEESGLQVEIVDFIDDVERTTSVCRYYLARRVGGTPADMGWESQACILAPKDHLYEILNRAVDHGIAEAIGAGPVPEPKGSLF